MTRFFSLTPLRLRRLALLAGIGAVTGIIYYLFDPATSPYAPKCIIRILTGYDCPGCGSQRVVHALLHGDIIKALQANLLLTLMLPYLIFWIWVETDPSLSPRLHRAMNSPKAIAVITVVIIIWWVARNIF